MKPPAPSLAPFEERMKLASPACKSADTHPSAVDLLLGAPKVTLEEVRNSDLVLGFAGRAAEDFESQLNSSGAVLVPRRLLRMASANNPYWANWLTHQNTRSTRVDATPEVAPLTCLPGVEIPEAGTRTSINRRQNLCRGNRGVSSTRRRTAVDTD